VRSRSWCEPRQQHASSTPAARKRTARRAECPRVLLVRRAQRTSLGQQALCRFVAVFDLLQCVIRPKDEGGAVDHGVGIVHAPPLVLRAAKNRPGEWTICSVSTCSSRVGVCALPIHHHGFTAAGNTSSSFLAVHDAVKSTGVIVVDSTARRSHRKETMPPPAISNEFDMFAQ
jgi:hypothetical protein